MLNGLISMACDSSKSVTKKNRSQQLSPASVNSPHDGKGTTNEPGLAQCGSVIQ